MASNPLLAPLVVVGSSAGGVEALSALVGTLPEAFPAPIVIAQHLDPSRPSHLGDILARRSPLPVVTVHEHEHLLPGTIYVIPSNYHVEVSDYDITLEPHGPDRPKPSIDLLLTTAAEVYGERLFAVILTGTGSDGAMGARAVKEAGGTVIIQDPRTAAYPGMPQSVEPHVVDIVADLPRIGSVLFALLTGVAVPTQADVDGELAPFLKLVHEQSGVDFSLYKTPTILRRLQRRIIAAGAADLAGYQTYLRQNPDEYRRLAASFLIKVTDFMRDQELFDHLRDKVLPELIRASRSSGKELRLWSAGCSTGQEAYSLAILVLEALGSVLPNFAIKIFATDLDGEAIAFARRGLYPPGTVGAMPEDLVNRYFTRSGGGYEVKKQVRSLVVFGEHDLGQRAPFPRIAMVLCRNVLIYFTQELQQRALQLFAFSLHEGGYLVLGTTESVTPAAEYFTPDRRKLKIYRRQGSERPAPMVPMRGPALAAPRRRGPSLVQAVPGRGAGAPRELFQAQQEAVQARLFKENLLLNLPVGVLVVDRRYDIQEINHTARRLLGIHTVAIGEDLLHLAQSVPIRAFRAAIDKAVRERVVTRLNEVELPEMVTGDPTFVSIECYPRPDGAGAADDQADEPAESVLVLVVDVTAMVQSKREIEHGNARLVAQTEELRVSNAGLVSNNEESRRHDAELEEARRRLTELADERRQLVADNQEVVARHARQIEMLADANRDLLTANEGVTRANSELRSTLDDLLTTNEDAQAALEEVETLNEEMQSTNEELETLNEEMQATVEELNTANSDLAARSDELQSLAVSLEVQKAQLEAILTGLADAVLVVTPDGQPLLTNEAYRRLFGSSEAGATAGEDGPGAVMGDEQLRPLPPAETPQQRAARGERFNMTLTLAAPAGGEPRWLEANGQPVIGEGGQQWGVVVIRDITDRSLRTMQEQFTELAGHELRTPLTVVRGYLQLLAKALAKQNPDERWTKYITGALAQTNRQMRLIDDLVDVTRLQSGKFSLRCEPLQLDTLLEQVVASGQLLTKDQQIALVVEGGGTAPGGSGAFLAFADRGRIEQAVLNLLSNAIRYAADGARIDVRLRRVDVSAADGDAEAMVEVRVQDYGPGIAAPELSQVFTRFYQIRRDTLQPAQGLGLGLFITRQIVEAHGGTITVESTVGQGATFIIRLPLLVPPTE
ncbi:MAG TPA: chemotaxis protein CheB [Chloroflexia bacterium]|nr:chemotaxis protein CheB [Chloroflexia bacterium]